MKLTYRGVSYDYTPPSVATRHTAETGKYRGVDIRFRTVHKSAVHQPTLDLVYRGAAYRTGSAPEPTAPAAPAPPAQPPVAAKAPVSLDLQARTMLLAHTRNIKRRQQSLLTRSAADVGLSADVTQYWNRIQGKVHPSFWATYDRGHAATS